MDEFNILKVQKASDMGATVFSGSQPITEDSLKTIEEMGNKK